MAGLNFPFQYERLGRQPIDVSDVFNSFAEFTAYLASGPAYAGQIVAVRDPPNPPTLYCISEGPPFLYTPLGEGGGGMVGVFWFEQEDGNLYFVTDSGLPSPFIIEDGNLYYIIQGT